MPVRIMRISPTPTPAPTPYHTLDTQELLSHGKSASRPVWTCPLAHPLSKGQLSVREGMQAAFPRPCRDACATTF